MKALPLRLALALLALSGCASSSGVGSSSTDGGGAGGSSTTGGNQATSGGGDGGGGASGPATATGTSVTSSVTSTTVTSSTGGESCSLPGDCPPTGSSCLIQACQSGVCDALLAPAGTPCTDGGGTECDGQGHCSAAACDNGVQDGAERGVDCGGGACPGCPVGTSCGAAVDCETEACVTGACADCGGSTQPCCPGDTCNGAVDTCVENTGQAWGGTNRECHCGVLREGQVLRVDDVRRSCDGRFRLVMQSDGNLVLYHDGVGALWSSNTFGTGSTYAVMQGDGNFVVYDAGGVPHFSTGSQGVGAYLAIQTDGNMVVYDGGGAVLYSSGTCCH